ncbi:MAG: sensor histidine kinase [Rikenellaceae bacterium]
MIIDEKKLFKNIDIGFYLIFVPIILLLIPTDRFVEIDPYFFMILMVYMSVIHYINRKFNPLTLIFDQKYHKGAVVVIATLLIALLITQMEVLDIRQFNSQTTFPKRTTEMKLRAIWVLYFLEFCFTIMLGLVLELFNQIKSRQSIEAEKNRAEVSLYRSQINPHFMLNTLNTLYGLYITKSDKTGDVFLKFSDMIKYMLSNSEKDKVMLCDEVTYLKEYIDLHSLRLGEQTSVNFDCSIDDESRLIPPMILITFVENAFKYGVSSSHKSSIDISISLIKGEFIFKTQNTIFSRSHKSTSIGIKNCKKRLDLLYANSYTLSYGEEESTNQYFTLLKIRL